MSFDSPDGTTQLEKKVLKTPKINPLNEVVRSLDSLAFSVQVSTDLPIKKALLLFDEKHSASFDV